MTGTETSLWLLSLLLVTDATTFTASLYTTTAAAAAAGSTRAFFRSTALPVSRLNTVISQNGPTSGTTAAPNGEKEVLVAAGAPELVSLCFHISIWFTSSLPFLPPVWPDLLSSQFDIRCVEREELKGMPCVMVSVETADCVSYFKSILLNVVKV